MRVNKLIQDWISRTIVDGSWKNYNDLHLDEIYSNYTNENSLRLAFGVIEVAKRFINLRYKSYDVVIGFSLITEPHPLGINFSNIESFQNELDWSPCSLYIYSLDDPDWKKTFEICEKIILKDFQLPLLYSEELINGFDEIDYRRVVWLKY